MKKNAINYDSFDSDIGDRKPAKPSSKKEQSIKSAFVIPKKNRSQSDTDLSMKISPITNLTKDEIKSVPKEESSEDMNILKRKRNGSNKNLLKKIKNSTKVKLESESEQSASSDFEVKPKLRKSKVVHRIKKETEQNATKIKNKPQVQNNNLTKRKLNTKHETKSVKSEQDSKIELPTKKSNVKVESIRKKKMSDYEKIENIMKAHKWWEEDDLLPGRKWNHLEHGGICFPDEYMPHGVPLLYKGEKIVLEPEIEEFLSFYADFPLDGPQLGDPEVAKIFNANFYADLNQILPKGHILKDSKFKDWNFSLMRDHIKKMKLIKKAATDDERAAAKAEKERKLLTYGIAIVDDHLEKVGNFSMEPPGLFRGRGKHPKTGKIKHRVYPNQVTLNIGEGAVPPVCPLPGFSWGAIQHDPSVTWLCKWTENISGSNKYSMLSASSSFKGKSDREKYNKAMQLKGYIEKIRKDYEGGLASKESTARQIATAMWLIDKLALRVGGEKDSGEEADTVGCCTLRVEHLTFNSDTNNEIELEFLGKDSMLFKQTIDFSIYKKIGSMVYKNLKDFIAKKKSSDQVFSDIDPSILNRHLNNLMPGLSAKVFRTFNASDTLQNELPSEGELENLTIQDKIVKFNDANRQVSILCNHQRTVSGSMIKAFDNLGETLNRLKEQKAEMETWLSISEKARKKIPLKTKKGEGSEIDILDAEVKFIVGKAKKLKAEAKTHEEKVQVTQLNEQAASKKRELSTKKIEEAHLFLNPPTQDQIKKRIMSWAAKIQNKDVDLRDRQQNKEVALGTAKINYMDPRITVAWCKRNEVPIEKVFAKTLRDKFVWAMNAPPDWEFSYSTFLQINQKKEGVKN